MAAVPNILGRGDYTREEFNRMEQTGILTDSYELIEGQLISKMGQNPPHGRTVERLCERLRQIFGYRHVREEKPLEVAEKDRRRNDPIPDISVIAEDKSEYDARHPRGDELLLLVEVSDATTRFDLSTKLSLYARAGVPEYWVLDVPKRRLFLHRDLHDEAYRDCRELTEHDTLTIQDAPIVLGEILPQRPAQ